MSALEKAFKDLLESERNKSKVQKLEKAKEVKIKQIEVPKLAVEEAKNFTGKAFKVKEVKQPITKESLKPIFLNNLIVQ